jgi:hypothetical protein
MSMCPDYKLETRPTDNSFTRKEETFHLLCPFSCTCFRAAQNAVHAFEELIEKSFIQSSHQKQQQMRGSEFENSNAKTRGRRTLSS